MHLLLLITGHQSGDCNVIGHGPWCLRIHNVAVSKIVYKLSRRDKVTYACDENYRKTDEYSWFLRLGSELAYARSADRIFLVDARGTASGTCVLRVSAKRVRIQELDIYFNFISLIYDYLFCSVLRILNYQITTFQDTFSHRSM